MPILTTKQRLTHREFLRRQIISERVYTPQFYRYLANIYAKAARMIQESGFDAYYQNVEEITDDNTLKAIYKRLYTKIIIKEAVYENKLIMSVIPNQKDLIDDLAKQFSFNNGNIIKLWRGLIGDYISVRVAERVTQVNRTTKRAIAKIIEKAIKDGLGARDTAKILREQQKFNRNRALAIARTETVAAANQGKFLAATSSPFEMEKAWSPTQDSKTRDSHAAMVAVPWIPLENDFYVATRKGGLDTARYPADESLSAENTVNCRCSMVVRPKKGENGALVRKF